MPIFVCHPLPLKGAFLVLELQSHSSHMQQLKNRSFASFSDPQLRHQDKAEGHARSICFPAIRLSLDKKSHPTSLRSGLGPSSTNYNSAFLFPPILGIVLQPHSEGILSTKYCKNGATKGRDHSSTVIW
jgi:hypothetical protein